MLGLHGAGAVFDAAQDDWSEYIERLEHYITANDIVSEDKQLHRGWTVDLPSNSIVAVASEGSLGEIVGKARAHFNPKHRQEIRI